MGLELRDGKRVAVSIQISLPPGDDIVGVDDSNLLAIVSGRATESKDLNSKSDKGIDVCGGLVFRFLLRESFSRL